MRSSSARLAGAVVAIGLGWFLFVQARAAWTNYWLRTDSRQGIAILTKKYWGGHGRFVYRYSVNGTEHTGVSSRDWNDPRYRNVQPLEEAVVYFSESHPSLSLLYKPRAVIEGIPVLLIALFLEIFAVVTLLRPSSGWAFYFSEKKQTNAA